ncbi:amino acid permease 5-like [Carya illinoinensis]|uniref:amino acid permease 5-like n=1 Tax=Carya illinoinensis TaxID=32201 RepID=UPI001C71E887|nr:amino acid permease 5-like [Carya illinoinensis]
MHQIQNTATNNQLPYQDLFPRSCSDSESVDDDGRSPKRAGNVARLGWVARPAGIIIFSLLTYCTSALLCACYRSPEVPAKRNHTYMDAIRSNLDGAKFKICLVINCLNLLGAASEYTVFAALMMMHVARDIKYGLSNCCNAADTCYVNPMPYFMAFAVAQIILFQIPKFPA